MCEHKEKREITKPHHHQICNKCGKKRFSQVKEEGCLIDKMWTDWKEHND